jgi:hypothetical protein
VTIPNSVTTIGSYAFMHCSALTSVTIPNSVTTIGVAPFNGCTALTRIYVGADNPNYASDGIALYNKAKTTLIECPGGFAGQFNVPNGVTTIMNEAFAACSKLTWVNIPDSVTTIGDYAFVSCTALDNVTMGTGVTSIGSYAFYHCSALHTITFLGLVAPTTVSADWIFATNFAIRGHAYANSNFPPPKGVWNGLIMGMTLGP